jgi:hypothetical protein
LDISLQLFHEPTLYDFISIQGTGLYQDRLKVLLQISSCTWFASEFVKIGGIAWLEQQIESIQNYDLCIKLISNVMKETIPNSELLRLTKLTKECLLRTSVPEEIRYTNNVQPYEVILHNRIKKGLRGSALSADWDDSCPPVNFKAWHLLITEVIAGLQRGFIDYPSRFVRDVDGICAGLNKD